MQKIMFATWVGIALLSAGCGDESSSPTGASSAPASVEDGHGHVQKSAHVPHAGAPTTTGAEHGRIPIGETAQAGFVLVATQGAPVKPGSEGVFDMVITGGKPKAVRFWVGTEDAKGSVKAKAEEETPENWHTHAEVPDPLPANSKFWVEVQPATGQTFKASFDLKQ